MDTTKEVLKQVIEDILTTAKNTLLQQQEGNVKDTYQELIRTVKQVLLDKKIDFQLFEGNGKATTFNPYTGDITFNEKQFTLLGKATGLSINIAESFELGEVNHIEINSLLTEEPLQLGMDYFEEDDLNKQVEHIDGFLLNPTKENILNAFQTPKNAVFETLNLIRNEATLKQDPELLKTYFQKRMEQIEREWESDRDLLYISEYPFFGKEDPCITPVERLVNELQQQFPTQTKEFQKQACLYLLEKEGAVEELVAHGDTFDNEKIYIENIKQFRESYSRLSQIEFDYEYQKDNLKDMESSILEKKNLMKKVERLEESQHQKKEDLNSISWFHPMKKREAQKEMNAYEKQLKSEIHPEECVEYFKASLRNDIETDIEDWINPQQECVDTLTRERSQLLRKLPQQIHSQNLQDIPYYLDSLESNAKTILEKGNFIHTLVEATYELLHKDDQTLQEQEKDSQSRYKLADEFSIEMFLDDSPEDFEEEEMY